MCDRQNQYGLFASRTRPHDRGSNQKSTRHARRIPADLVPSVGTDILTPAPNTVCPLFLPSAPPTPFPQSSRGKSPVHNNHTRTPPSNTSGMHSTTIANGFILNSPRRPALSPLAAEHNLNAWLRLRFFFCVFSRSLWPFLLVPSLRHPRKDFDCVRAARPTVVGASSSPPRVRSPPQTSGVGSSRQKRPGRQRLSFPSANSQQLPTKCLGTSDTASAPDSGDSHRPAPQSSAPPPRE
jgi:hypothetical protein